MPQIWRWDQGRLNYFNFYSLKRIASVLVQLEGVELHLPDLDPLRPSLKTQTLLPFLPTHYKVWRNYARIFKWTLIAAKINNCLMTTDVCRKLAEPATTAWDIDQYLSFIILRIYYPSPATQNYSANDPQTFSFCAILKYLLAIYRQRGESAIDLQTVFSRLVGNEYLGTESIESYLKLPETKYQPKGNQTRQLREILIFISQSSFLNSHL